ncbi:MAG TPA: hypothetical protein PK987_02110 [Ferruginibacter sp.]|nr:hypothetical protein [Ferruginibacter sp.]
MAANNCTEYTIHVCNYTASFFGKPFGTKPAPDYILLIIEFLLLLLLIFLLSIKLHTSINDTGIYYRFYPFQFKQTAIEWHELRDVYIREYNSFYEYGGRGIRYGSAKVGRAINTSASCNKGLQLQFNNGELLLIGTTKPIELQTIVDKVITSGKINRAI